MILVVLVLRSSNSGSSGSTSSTTISSITTWGPYHGGGGPLTRNTKPYIHIYLANNKYNLYIFTYTCVYVYPGSPRPLK